MNDSSQNPYDEGYRIFTAWFLSWGRVYTELYWVLTQVSHQDQNLYFDPVKLVTSAKILQTELRPHRQTRSW